MSSFIFTPPESADPLVRQLLALLAGGQSHATLADAVKDFPEKLRGTVPQRLPYSGWQLLEHLRIAQRDILDFCSPPEGGYRHMEWPKDYWPATAEPPTQDSWDETVAALETDAKSFAALLTKRGADLNAPLPWGDGQTLLREALLIADHNSYHTGELIVLRRLLGAWKS